MKQKVRQFFEETSLSKKLTYILVAYTICLTIVIFISYSSILHLIQTRTIENTKVIGQQTVNSIQAIIADAFNIAEIPNRSTDIQNFLIQSNNTPLDRLDQGAKKEMYRRELDFIRSLKVYNNFNEENNSFYVFNNKGRVFYDKKNEQTSTYTKEDYNALRNILHTSGTQDGPVVSMKLFPSNDHPKPFYVFSVIREVRDVYTKEELGIAVVETDKLPVSDFLERLNTITGGEVRIVEQKDIPLPSRISKLFHYSDKAISQGSQSDYSYFYEPIKQVITIKVPFSLHDWNLLITVPVSQLVSDIRQIQFVLLGAILFLMSITILAILLISKSIVTPLRILMRKMRSIKETDDLRATFHTNRKDEIGQLYSQFNNMFQNIRELMTQTKHMERKNKEIELDALQGQINPHFIYNTLETIRMSAEMSDDEETADMIYRLSQLMRYSIKHGFETCILSEESTYVQNYMDLINFRFGNRFILHLQGTEEYKEYPVMKMLLQPLVENATIHGFNSSAHNMNITISCKKTEEAFYLYIQDDGIGMSEERLKHVRRKLKTEEQYPTEQGKKSIGMRNVNERIKILYGDSYGLQIYSSEGAGTTVEVKLPLPNEEE